MRTLPLFLVLSAGAAAGAPLVLTGSQGNLSASVSFDITVFNNLRVVLTNTSTHDVKVPSEVLTALFFDIVGDPSLTPVSAGLGPDSAVWFGGTDPGGIVGGEWAYRSGLAGAPGGAHQGLSSAGLNLFGPHDRFPGSNLQGPDSPDGLQYGLTSAGDDPSTGNTPVTGGYALIHSSVVFTLGDLPSGFRLADISNVSFQYGTSLCEFTTFADPPSETPEPGSAALAAIGFALLAAAPLLRRLFRSPSASSSAPGFPSGCGLRARGIAPARAPRD